MWRSCLIALLVVTFVAASASAASPVAPSYVQRGIAKRYRPELRYLPTRLPVGFRYAAWHAYRLGFDIYFKRGPNGPPLLGFHVLVASCASYDGHMRAFKIDGVTVFWSAAHSDQQAWRCLTVGRLHLVLSSSNSVSGDSLLNTPKRRRDALDLARLVAFARRTD